MKIFPLLTVHLSRSSILIPWTSLNIFSTYALKVFTRSTFLGAMTLSFENVPLLLFIPSGIQSFTKNKLVFQERDKESFLVFAFFIEPLGFSGDTFSGQSQRLSLFD